MKVILMFANTVMAFILGVFFGSLISGILFVLIVIIVKVPWFINASKTTLSILLYSPSILLGLLGVYLELKKSSNDIINYFQDSFLRKIYPIIGVSLIVAVSLMSLVKIDDYLYKKYRLFAKEITERIYKSFVEGKTTVEIDNRWGIEYILVTEAYSLTKESLLKTGKVSKKLAKSMTKKNAESDGTYLHLAKDDKVMAVVSFNPYISVENHFQIARVKDKIRFFVRKEKRKDIFGKNEHEELVIYKVN